ncbi:MAG: hypothetical protein JWN64_213 [Parcubacteria group bacterium]|nr:hypothetical protein [Parcubacteria group bacterium]
MEKEYAQAIIELSKKGENQKILADSLVAHLKAEGRIKLLPGILRQLKHEEARTKKLAPTLEVASDAEKAHARKAASLAGIEAEEVTVNPSLLRGWRARTGSKLIDHSAKSTLIQIYQKITN